MLQLLVTHMQFKRTHSSARLASFSMAGLESHPSKVAIAVMAEVKNLPRQHHLRFFLNLKNPAQTVSAPNSASVIDP